MPNSKQIVYLSQSQYAELIANGTITVDGVTVTYDENDIYVTPQAEPVTDVRINGSSVAANGVANIPVATSSMPGVIKVGGRATFIGSDGTLGVNTPTSGNIKAGTEAQKVIPVYMQHEATFYGLAKVAGHDEASSTESVGTYTPEAKGAIQQMLGVSDLIATAENDLVASKAYAIGDIFTANGKLYKATATIAADAAIIPAVEGEEIAGANCVETSVGEGFPHDVQVNGTSVVTDGVANVPLAVNRGATGVVKLNQSLGITETLGTLKLAEVDINTIKSGGNAYYAISPKYQHNATFYGLAKAAGADEKDSTLPVGQYTDTAKAAIRSMLGATSSNVIAVQDTQPTDADTKIWLPETAETPVEVPTVAEMNAALSEKVGDVQVNGVSVVSNGIASLSKANATTYGLVKTQSGNTGVYAANDGTLYLATATDAQMKSGSGTYPRAITPGVQNKAVFYGLAQAAGDVTQAASDNAVGAYTDEAKKAIRQMLGIPNFEWELIADVTVPENTTRFDITTDLFGQPFNLSKMLVRAWLESATTGSNSYVAATCFAINSNDVAVTSPAPTKRYMTNGIKTFFEYVAELMGDVCYVIGSSTSVPNSTGSVEKISSTEIIKSITGFRMSQYSDTSSLIPANSVIKIYGIRV